MKVKYIKENYHNLVKNRIYDAFIIKSNFPGKEKIFAVVDDLGEEYAYPKVWFEVINIKKVKYIGENDSVSLIRGKIYDCLGEEHGEYRIIDEEGYDKGEEIQGYLYPKRFFVEVNDE